MKKILFFAVIVLFAACTGNKAESQSQNGTESETNSPANVEETDAASQASAGKTLPEIMLDTRDGKQVSIASLRGKYTYIDVWATWCGPCCREIPFLEKLVEQMKDNDKLQFVSLSLDADREAWETKLANDKPAWAQFILSEEASNTLCEALSITGIPRFIVLGPDGSIVNEDAIRPSDPAIVEYLEGIVK